MISKQIGGIFSGLSVCTLLYWWLYRKENTMTDETSGRFTKTEEPRSVYKSVGSFTFDKTEESSLVNKYKLLQNGKQVNYKETMILLEKNVSFRTQLIDTLKEAMKNNEAYFFETPPVNLEQYDQVNFEFVLVKSERLSKVKVDAITFADRFKPSSIVTFGNIAKDAMLVVPCPIKTNDDDMSQYAHLAAFINRGDSEQVQEFWRIVGKEMNERVKIQGQKYTWLSTSGLGVFWLHMRLDSIPKYYTYAPYRDK